MTKRRVMKELTPVERQTMLRYIANLLVDAATEVYEGFLLSGFAQANRAVSLLAAELRRENKLGDRPGRSYPQARKCNKIKEL